MRLLRVVVWMFSYVVLYGGGCLVVVFGCGLLDVVVCMLFARFWFV